MYKTFVCTDHISFVWVTVIFVVSKRTSHLCFWYNVLCHKMKNVSSRCTTKPLPRPPARGAHQQGAMPYTVSWSASIYQAADGRQLATFDFLWHSHVWWTPSLLNFLCPTLQLGDHQLEKASLYHLSTFRPHYVFFTTFVHITLFDVTLPVFHPISPPSAWMYSLSCRQSTYFLHHLNRLPVRIAMPYRLICAYNSFDVSLRHIFIHLIIVLLLDFHDFLCCLRLSILNTHDLRLASSNPARVTSRSNWIRRVLRKIVQSVLNSSWNTAGHLTVLIGHREYR